MAGPWPSPFISKSITTSTEPQEIPESRKESGLCFQYRRTHDPQKHTQQHKGDVHSTSPLIFFYAMPLFVSFFQLAVLFFFLAGDAIARPGNGLQTLGIDLIAAAHALSERTFADPLQRRFHHLQQLAFVVALRKQKFLGVGTRSTVCDVLGRILIGDAAIFFRAAYGPA